MSRYCIVTLQYCSISSTALLPTISAVLQTIISAVLLSRTAELPISTAVLLSCTAVLPIITAVLLSRTAEFLSSTAVIPASTAVLLSRTAVLLVSPGPIQAQRTRMSLMLCKYRLASAEASLLIFLLLSSSSNGSTLNSAIASLSVLFIKTRVHKIQF